MNFYHQPAHRQQQRELNFQPRSLPNTAAEFNKPHVPQLRNAHLDSDRVLPPLATSSDGAKFVPFWKRNQQVTAATTQQVVHQQQTAQPPKKKWLTQAEMGMVSPAIIPLPIPTARTSTTTTTTTTTNTSTTTNNNVGTTVSSSGSGITASSVTGRTFNYNYNNYNHHVHQFNQPTPNAKPAAFPPPGPSGPSHNGPGYVNRLGKPMPSAWHGPAPTTLQLEHGDEEEEGDDDETTSQQDEDEEDETSSASPGPQYGILDLPSRRHRRAHSQPQWTSSIPHEPAMKNHVKFKNKKAVYQDPVLPTPSVLVLQTPNNRRSGDYTPAYAYEYSLKYDREGRHSHVERKQGHRRHLRCEEMEETESEEEEDSDEEDEDSSPLPKKKKKVKSGDKKSTKSKNAKAKSKGKKKPSGKARSKKSRKSHDEENDSEEEDSEEDEEEEDEESDEDEEEEMKKKTKTRMSTSSKVDKKKTQNMSMSLQLASLGINDDHVHHGGNSQHRLSRSEDYTRQSQSIFSASSRNTPVDTPNKWPVDLPRLPRTPGTPADAVTGPGSSHDVPTKQHNSYFDYQPHQQRWEQPQSNYRSQTHTSGSGSSVTPSTNSSTPASTYSTPATSYTSMSDHGRQQDKRYMNLDDPPPSSLRRTPSPGYPSSSHSHTRSLPHIGVNPTPNTVTMPTSFALSPSSQPNDQMRTFVQQSRIQGYQPQNSQARPQPPEPARRFSHNPSNFHSSYAFWQQQQVQQPQQQHSSHPSPQPSQQSLPTSSSSNGSIIGSRYASGGSNGYRNVQTPASAPVPAPQAPSPSRRRELPPQPAQGRERAQEILREAMERQTQIYNSPPQPHQPPLPPPQQQQQSRQWHATLQSGTSVPASSFAPPVQRSSQPPLPQQQPKARQPLPQPQQPARPMSSIQQYRQPLVQQPQQPPPSQHPHPLQRPQPSVPQHPQPSASQRPQPTVPQHPQPSAPQRPQPTVPQHPQPSAPQRPQPSVPQQPQPSVPQRPQSSAPQRPQPSAPQHPRSLPQHPQSLPPQPPRPPSQQHRRQPQPPQQPPIHQHRRPESRPLSRPQSQLNHPPQAQRNVYRRPSMPLESPLPVGGRDKVADIPRMGKAASVVDSSSGYGSGGSVSASESEVESLQSASQRDDGTDDNEDPIPGIEIHVSGDGGGGDDRSSYRASSVASSPQVPVIHVQEEEEVHRMQTPSTVVPQIQVADVPGISFTDPEDDGGGPSITVSTPEGKSRPLPKLQSTPSTPSPHHQRARSAPALVHLDKNAAAGRNRGGLSCGGCRGPIIGRIVNAMGARWHPQCFRCTACDTLLEHVSSYEYEGKPYCHLDYHENFAPRCYHCKTAIIEERFISLDDPALGKRTYHEQHFFCAECGDPFLTPSSTDFENDEKRSGELALSGDGEFESDNVGFTVYRGHPYCESCHVRLRLPKCKRCKKSIRDGDRAVEALGGKWCWACFVCESCQKPFEDPAFFQRAEKPYCEPCFSLMLRNEV